MIPFLKQKIWYAFQGLTMKRVDSVDRLPYSICLVLTNNLMNILQFDDLSETFKRDSSKYKFEENEGITFNDYLDFFESYLNGKMNQIDSPGSKEIYSSSQYLNYSKPHSTEALSVDNKFVHLCKKAKLEMAPLIKTFDDYCWTLYRKRKIEYLSSNSPLNHYFLNLWLLFIQYSITDPETKEVVIPVAMDKVEAAYWCDRMVDLLGIKRLPEDIEIEENIMSIQLHEFFDMFQEIFKKEPINEDIIGASFQQLMDEALEGVIIKGALKIDRCKRFCILKSSILFIYNSKNDSSSLRSCIVFSQDTDLTIGTYKIQIKSPGLTFITSTTIEIDDLWSFNKWRSAFTDAIKYSEANIGNPAAKKAESRAEARRLKRSAIQIKRRFLEVKVEEDKKEMVRVNEALQQRLIIANEELCLLKERLEAELKEKEQIINQRDQNYKTKEMEVSDMFSQLQSRFKKAIEKRQEVENEKTCLEEKLQAIMEEKTDEEMKRMILEEKNKEMQLTLLEAEEKIIYLDRTKLQLEINLEEERKAKEKQDSALCATVALLDEEQKSKEKLESLLQHRNHNINDNNQRGSVFSQQLQKEKSRIKSNVDEMQRLINNLDSTRANFSVTGNNVKKIDSKVTKMARDIFGMSELESAVIRPQTPSTDPFSEGSSRESTTSNFEGSN